MIFSKQKRFLIFNDSLAQGGTEHLLINLLEHLVDKRCNVTLILPEELEENVLLVKVPEEVKIKYLYTQEDSNFTKKWGETKMIFRTKSFLKSKGIDEQDYDEVICFKEGFYAKMFSHWKLMKTLWLHNILYIREYEVNSLSEKLAVWLNKKKIAKTQASYANYERVISVSEACKKSYLNVVYGGCLPIQDIRIVPNAIKQGEIIEMSKADINEDWTSQEALNFILLTRRSPEKRIDRIIHASSRLQQEGYKFKVHILGSGTDSDDLKSQISTLELEDQIQLYGEIENPYPYIKRSDWLICVSERESFSLAILEAMLLGIPVITTDCGGPTNIIENGKYGLLVENSSEGVYEGMKSVLTDSSLTKRYTTDLQKCTERYKYENWIKTINTLFSI